MKQIFLIVSFVVIIILADKGFPKADIIIYKNSTSLLTSPLSEKDTCVIEGKSFIMRDYHSKRVMRAYIKNSQMYVVNDGLQFAKYRIIQYVFSSLTDEYLPIFRAFNQRLSPPIIQVLKNARPGEQYLFEEIVVVDQSNKILANEVRPLMIERIKN
jgi:hypothetical protein